jgi:hypothetical protein
MGICNATVVAEEEIKVSVYNLYCNKAKQLMPCNFRKTIAEKRSIFF